jgi:hypothetical protein
MACGDTPKDTPGHSPAVKNGTWGHTTAIKL